MQTLNKSVHLGYIMCHTKITELWSIELYCMNLFFCFENRIVINVYDSFFWQPYTFLGQWSGLQQAPGAITQWDTGVDINTLKYVGAKSVALPEDFVS